MVGRTMLVATPPSSMSPIDFCGDQFHCRAEVELHFLDSVEPVGGDM